MKYFLPLVFIFLLSCRPGKKPGPGLQLLQTTHLSHYSSASSLAFSAGKLYVIGDDAPYLLILDSDHQPVDSLQLFDGAIKRIPKAIKADLEASALLTQSDTLLLYAISSFSTPARNRILCFTVDKNGKLQLRNNQAVFLRLPGEGEINIEGAACIQNRLVLSNRANTTTKINQLLVSGIDKDTLQSDSIKLIPVMLPGMQKIAGISGLHYLPEKDLLLFSASTEETPNAYTDGPVGESYIGYISAISTRWNATSLTADTLIALSPYLRQAVPQKIESITVESVTGNNLVIHLAADNDNGESTLYKIRWTL